LTRSYCGMNIYKEFAAKPTKLMDFLCRNLHQCTVNVKHNCYKTMVCPIVKYASTVWAPNTLSNVNHQESIQRRAARFCYNDFSSYSSVTAMMSSLNMSTLGNRRPKAKFITMHKILNDNLDVPKSNFIITAHQGKDILTNRRH